MDLKEESQEIYNDAEKVFLKRKIEVFVRLPGTDGSINRVFAFGIN